MCLIVFDWQPEQPHWLTLAANRDEFRQRPAIPLACWEDNPRIIAGRDLEQGGTWLGINRAGAFAAITNIRAPGAGPAKPPSRGQLVADYLSAATDPGGYARALSARARHYAPFNLLVGDQQALYYVSNYPQLRCEPVTPGIHSLSNAWLDTAWPKTTLAEQQLRQWQQQGGGSGSLAMLLGRQAPFADELLPATGVPAEWERLLSAQFIIAPGYGTRCSTALRGREQQLDIHEISWNEQGQPADIRRQQLILAGKTAISS